MLKWKRHPEIGRYQKYHTLSRWERRRFIGGGRLRHIGQFADGVMDAGHFFKTHILFSFQIL